MNALNALSSIGPLISARGGGAEARSWHSPSNETIYFPRCRGICPIPHTEAYSSVLLAQFHLAELVCILSRRQTLIERNPSFLHDLKYITHRFPYSLQRQLKCPLI